MPIIHLGAHSKQARAMADDLRSTRINQGKGALIVDEKQGGEPRHLLEKIIKAEALPADGTPVPADTVPWKTDPLVILVGKDAPKVLDKFEALVPGFKKKFGPVTAAADA